MVAVWDSSSSPSLVSREHSFCQLNESVSLGGRLQLADLSDCFTTVALGEVGGLVDTITLSYILPRPLNVSRYSESPHYHGV